MPVTNNQRKLGIGVVIVGILYFTPALMETIYNLFASKPPAVKAAAAPVKQQPIQSQTQPPGAFSQRRTIIAQPTGPAAPYLGKWSGPISSDGGFNCGLSVEFTQHSESPNKLYGYSRIECPTQLPPFIIKQKFGDKMARRYTPESTVLSADLTTNPLQFLVDQNIGSGCPVKSITVTPFGTSQLSLAFEDECGKGDAILTRTR